VIRVLHFSDVHVEDGFDGVPVREFLNKRLVAYGNLVLNRRRHFREARRKLAALTELMHAQKIDVSVCTGDYTALGTHPELELARATIEPLTRAPMGFVTVPGNHDVYLPDTLIDSRFDKYFGNLLRTDLPGLSVDGIWPQVRLFGDHLAVVAVNSSRPNPEVYLSSGRIPDEQLDLLARIVEDERVKGRFVLVATHYAPRLSNGLPDRPTHGLENAEALFEALRPVDRGAIVFGHVHRRYHVRVSDVAMALCSAGSATHSGREGIWVYEIEADSARGIPGTWDGERYVLLHDEAVSLHPH